MLVFDFDNKEKKSKKCENIYRVLFFTSFD